jgi:hypothetical protein
MKSRRDSQDALRGTNPPARNSYVTVTWQRPRKGNKPASPGLGSQSTSPLSIKVSRETNLKRTMTNRLHPPAQRQAALSMLAQLSELIVIYSTTSAHQPGHAAYVERAQKLRSKLARTVLGSSRKPRKQLIS